MVRTLFSVLALGLVTCVGFAQGDVFPDTPAGRAAQRWFGAVRSGDANRIRDLIENHFDADFRDRVGVEQHLSRHLALADAGINAPHSVAASSEHEITLYVRDGGVWGELRISVSPEPPHGITGVGVRPSNGPPEARGRPKTPLEFRDETFEFLDALHESGGFNGSVFVTGHSVAWVAPGARERIPIDFILEAIKLAVPLSVSHRSWRADHPHAQPLVIEPDAETEFGVMLDELERLRRIAQARGAGGAGESENQPSLVESIFGGDRPAERAFQRGLVNALVFEPLGMTDCEVPFGAEPRMNTADLARFGRGILDPEYIPAPLLTAATAGFGPDLDPSPHVVRRAALAGFEERIDANGVRSFSLLGRAGDDLVLLRCYPSVPTAVVIVAQDVRTLELIDRRIFNRLPGLPD